MQPSRKVSFHSDLTEDRPIIDTLKILCKTAEAPYERGSSTETLGETLSVGSEGNVTSRQADKVRRYYRNMSMAGSFNGSRTLRRKGCSGGLIKHTYEYVDKHPIQINCSKHGVSMDDSAELVSRSRWSEEDDYEASFQPACQVLEVPFQCKVSHFEDMKQ